MVGRPVLDDPEALLDRDPGGLLAAFLSLPDQLAAGYRVATAAGPVLSEAPPSITFCAMGGSAAAADLVAAEYRVLPVPVAVSRGYTLPGHCRGGAVVVCISYSGGTEETLAAYDAGRERGCHVVAISSGGELAERAARDGVPWLPLPAGHQPRAAVGSMVGTLLGILAGEGRGASRDAVDAAVAELRAVAEAVGPAVPLARNDAKDVAAWIGEAVPLVWGSEGIAEAVAWRWKCALNENAKIPAFATSLPELDHHEVEGWSDGRGERFRLVVLRHANEHPRVAARVDVTLRAIEGSGLEWREVWAPSERVPGLSLVLLGDVASAYHALARGLDPSPIPVIARVKSGLAASAT